VKLIPEYFITSFSISCFTSINLISRIASLIITDFRETKQHTSIINYFILYYHRELYSRWTLEPVLMNPKITLVTPLPCWPSEISSSSR